MTVGSQGYGFEEEGKGGTCGPPFSLWGGVEAEAVVYISRNDAREIGHIYSSSSQDVSLPCGGDESVADAVLIHTIRNTTNREGTKVRHLSGVPSLDVMSAAEPDAAAHARLQQHSKHSRGASLREPDLSCSRERRASRVVCSLGRSSLLLLIVGCSVVLMMVAVAWNIAMLEGAMLLTTMLLSCTVLQDEGKTDIASSNLSPSRMWP